MFAGDELAIRWIAERGNLDEALDAAKRGRFGECGRHVAMQYREAISPDFAQDARAVDDGIHAIQRSGKGLGSGGGGEVERKPLDAFVTLRGGCAAGDNADAMTPLQQGGDDMRADEAAAAGDEYGQ